MKKEKKKKMEHSHDQHHGEGAVPIVTTPFIYIFALYVAYSQIEATIWMVTLVIIASLLILLWSWKNEKKDVENRLKNGGIKVVQQEYQKYYQMFLDQQQREQQEAAAASAFPN